MNCGRAAGRCCGASGRRGCNCARAIWNWTGWSIRRAVARRSIVLTNKEFALLEHLMLNRGQCVSRVELLDSVWNLEPAQTTNIVDVYVNYLRRKLEDPPPGRLIRTVRGRGYMVPSDAEMQLAATAPPAETDPLAAANPAAPTETAPDAASADRADAG